MAERLRRRLPVVAGLAGGKWLRLVLLARVAEVRLMLDHSGVRLQRVVLVAEVRTRLLAVEVFEVGCRRVWSGVESGRDGVWRRSRFVGARGGRVSSGAVLLLLMVWPRRHLRLIAVRARLPIARSSV